MQKYLDAFHTLKSERGDEFRRQHGLVIKTGEGLGAAILKLLKPTWTTDEPDQLLNNNGLFFSVWVDQECEATGIARYNLHAKKLRAIKGEAFAARQFARTFRSRFQDELKNWPQCTFPKGPITLFEGHFPLNAETLHADTSRLLDQFANQAPQLDRLLSE